ncbi:MAG: 2-dehydropantoate 2-reductase [Alphaproteobacteria bacterium]|jgi:2-dehydropantoate 2-reductase|nr:2-dehydropantoate 2-reductase [Alphaproteobacteria bacterium]
MKICIFGAGAVGSFLAARLAQSGKQVSVIVRGPHLAAIQKDGLTLQAKDGDITVRLPASDNPAELGPQDLVIVSAKTPSLPQVAQGIAPLLHADTTVAFAINGVFWFYGDGFKPNGIAPDTARLDRDGSLHRLIGVERSLGIIVRSSNEVVAPGVVRNESANNGFTIGEATPGRATDRTPALAAALDGSGFIIKALSDIRHDMWAKLVRNSASSPLCSLTGSDVATAYNDKAIGELAMALMRETASIAQAHGFPDLLPDPGEALRMGLNLHHKPSMLQDLERGRAMEIDSQLAILQDLARQAKIATPVLDTLLPMLVMRAKTAGCY